MRAQLNSRITLTASDLGPAIISTLKHAASMPNPEYYDRQRQRRSTWNIPRYLQSYDETLEGNLILPRGLRPLLTQLVESAGSALKFEDRRSSGFPQQFDGAVQLRPEQQRAVEALDQVEQGIRPPRPVSGKR